MTRIAIGAVAVVLPRLVLRPWIGADAGQPSARLLSRALGGRDMALGLGALLAMNHGGPVRGWLEAGGLADAGDVLATVLGWPHESRWGRWMVLAAAGTGVASAAVLSGAVD